MIDRKPFENGSNPGREREEAVLRGVNGWLEPSEPWLARRNGISSAFTGAGIWEMSVEASQRRRRRMVGLSEPNFDRAELDGAIQAVCHILLDPETTAR